MSSFPENNVAAAAAATEIQESLAQNPMQLAADATTVYQPEDDLLSNLVKPSEVMNDQNICNDANDVYAQPEAVVLAQSASEAAAQVAVTEFPALDAGVVNKEVNVSVVANDQNNGNNIRNAAVNEVLLPSETNPPPHVMNDQNNGNNIRNEAVNEVLLPSETNPPPHVMNDQNNGNDNNAVLDGNSNGSNEVFVTPGVVGNQNNNGSNESVVGDQNIQNNHGSNEEVVVTPSVVGNQNNNNGSNEVVIPGVVGDQNKNVSNEVVIPSNQNNNGSNEVEIPSAVGDENNNCGSNEIVTPTVVVNYQNNGIHSNPVAINSGVGVAIKRKRGRPRKYPVGGASAVPAASSPSMAMQSGGQVQGSIEKRGRGRPVGSGKKHKADGSSSFTVSPANSGSTGAVFSPYVITVRSGEYVQPTLLSLSQYDKQVVCVLSASGTLSNVTLQQPQTTGGTVVYQGCFEILSLSGSFLQSESGGQRSISGGLSVLLAVPNGGIFGGGVAGPLIADSDVQYVKLGSGSGFQEA
ncbi:hypothetical protein AgCh_025123 [Apium graveolens]